MAILNKKQLGNDDPLFLDDIKHLPGMCPPFGWALGALILVGNLATGLYVCRLWCPWAKNDKHINLRNLRGGFQDAPIRRCFFFLDTPSGAI